MLADRREIVFLSDENQIAFKWLDVITFNVLHPQAALSTALSSYESLIVASVLSTF